MATYKISAALCPSSLLDLGGAFQQNLCRPVTKVVVGVSPGPVKGLLLVGVRPGQFRGDLLVASGLVRKARLPEQPVGGFMNDFFHLWRHILQGDPAMPGHCPSDLFQPGLKLNPNFIIQRRDQSRSATRFGFSLNVDLSQESAQTQTTQFLDGLITQEIPDSVFLQV